MTDEKGVIHFESPDEMDRRIREDLAEDLGCSIEEVTFDADEYEFPDPDEEELIPADEFYGDE